MKESISDILATFEEAGLVFKTFDYKKQDYVYHYTSLGRAMRRFMDGHNGRLPRTKKEREIVERYLIQEER